MLLFVFFSNELFGVVFGCKLNSLASYVQEAFPKWVEVQGRTGKEDFWRGRARYVCAADTTIAVSPLTVTGMVQ